MLTSANGDMWADARNAIASLSGTIVDKVTSHQSLLSVARGEVGGGSKNYLKGSKTKKCQKEGWKIKKDQ